MQAEGIRCSVSAWVLQAGVAKLVFVEFYGYTDVRRIVIRLPLTICGVVAREHDVLGVSRWLRTFLENADGYDADADYVPVIESDNEEEVSIVDDAPVAAKKGVNRKRGRPRKILRVGAPTKQAAHEKASSSNSSVNATMYLLEAQKKLQLKSVVIYPLSSHCSIT
jgi:hypothetical protein